MINHFHSIQLRITGTGNLKGVVSSLPDRNNAVITKNLADLDMTNQTSKMPILITNFMQERMKVRFSVTEIDEQFTIGKISVFIKPVYTGVPQ